MSAPPGKKRLRTQSASGLRMIIAPSGTYPELIPLATVRMSGTTSQFSHANQRPVRPNPAITSSQTRRIPCRSHTSLIACR